MPFPDCVRCERGTPDRDVIKLSGVNLGDLKKRFPEGNIVLLTGGLSKGLKLIKS